MLFALGTIDPLLVQDGLVGFNRAQTGSRIAVLSTGGSELDEVLQQGYSPLSEASFTAILTSEADLLALQGYYATGEPVQFTDGNGNATDVRVWELATTDFTGWWEAQVLLLESDEPVAS